MSGKFGAEFGGGRPLSPHLSIYRPQITSMLSILHRGTGVFLFLGLVCMLWIGITSVMYGICDCLYNFMHTDLFKVFCSTLAFCLCYHLSNGIRHLVWDMGRGMEISSIYKSGYIMLLCALILSFLMWEVIWTQI